ncbi:hypothetical protein BaRGS_00001336 [Batillaria attramentaria]|uniref:Uncharacterized protein n=1 Tax=Batillaria attramentaria TaxID=370345 RepID=A0ABD0M6W5_9CAEN
MPWQKPGSQRTDGAGENWQMLIFRKQPGFFPLRPIFVKHQGGEQEWSELVLTENKDIIDLAGAAARPRTLAIGLINPFLLVPQDAKPTRGLVFVDKVLTQLSPELLS